MSSYIQRLTNALLGWASWINRYSAVRIGLVLGAILFAIVSLLVSNRLVGQMAREERLKMEIWAEATHALASNDVEQALSFPLRILESNTSIPIIITNEQGEILNYNNIELPRRNPEKYLYQRLQEFRQGYPPIVIESYPREYLYYSDSTMLRQLLLFPYVQLAVFLMLLGIAVLAIYSLKRADQNHIWEGLSRETAHQLGTPISSLVAWRELLGHSGADPRVLHEMGKDIERLETIADRFQKVGSKPRLEPLELSALLSQSIAYMQPRVSGLVEIALLDPTKPKVWAWLNPSLVAWVFENLIKNAVDAMQAKGRITIDWHEHGRWAIIDVSDTGRGIRKAQYEAIFRPGYTTRLRGWGLGLSLARRIISEYHHGRIFVKHSEVGVGTTFRIMLERADPPTSEVEQAVPARLDPLSEDLPAQ